MAQCDPVTYANVTRPVFESIRQELEANGFAVPGDGGTLTGPFGIAVEYQWNEEAATLFTLVTEKSFFVSCNMIYERLDGAVNKFIA